MNETSSVKALALCSSLLQFFGDYVAAGEKIDICYDIEPDIIHGTGLQ